MAQETVQFGVDREVGLRDTARLEQALSALPGVAAVRLDRQHSSIGVDYDRTRLERTALQDRIESMGYPVSSVQVQAGE